MRVGFALLAPAILAADAVPDYAADAVALDRLIVANYAYADRLPGGTLPDTPALAAAREKVRDRASLLHYAEDRLATLLDHHASTGASFRDSWALVPSYADLWIDEVMGDFTITAVRPGSPAADAAVRPGDRLVAIGGVPVATAVVGYWSRLGLGPAGERASHAARVLAAGRRDRPRHLTIARGTTTRTLTLPSLYAAEVTPPAVAVTRRGRATTIAIGNALGDRGTIAAFDRAMAAVPPGASVTIDLANTPSGGNTTVARAMMGWFVQRPTSYQIHDRPAEARETGVARRWIEQVLPRAGKHHAGPLRIVVGRWTGSMGEGLAIGFAALGARVCGGPMAGLRGAIDDFTLPASGLTVKFPYERLYTVGGVRRERWVAPACR